MRARLLLCSAFVAVSAAAQQPLFHPDDFVDPASHAGPVFLIRAAVGTVLNPVSHYRPLPDDTSVVLLTNSLYAGPLQFDYKHTQAFGADAPVQRCDCPDPVYFPTPPPADATPGGPPPGPSNTLQLAFYRPAASGTLRYRLSFTRQELETVVTSIATGREVERRSGHDQSLTLDADTHFRIGRRDVWGTLYVARTWSKGTLDPRAQNELGYVYRPAGWSARGVLFRAKVTTGILSGRGATSLNLVNPYLEALWRHRRSNVNFHWVWSPRATKSGEGWRIDHEIAFFVDRTLYLKIFGS